MTQKDLFKAKLADLIYQAELDRCDQSNTLDLRASRNPYNPTSDNGVFLTTELDEVYEFVKDSEEWYVDIYENYADENRAEFIDYTLASWEE